jgi:hypothetical protein
MLDRTPTDGSGFRPLSSQQPRLPAEIHVLPVKKGLTQFHIGRREELARLVDLAAKRVNLILIGPQGVGKTHLLDNLSLPRIIRLDELSAPKRLLAAVAVELSRLKPAEAARVFGAESRIDAIILRNTTRFLIDGLIALTQPLEYTLIIDDVTRITPSGIDVLEKLKHHFHIICAARQVEARKASFLSNFERIDLGPLPPQEAGELAMRLSAPFLDRIEDPAAYRNHILDSTRGIPLFICEMTERYAREADVSNAVLRDIRHTAARKEINFLPFLIGVLACMSVLRYWGRISGQEDGPFYFLAAIGVIFLFFGREIVRATRKKYL